MPEAKKGCAPPAPGILKAEEAPPSEGVKPMAAPDITVATIGQEAPDFEANAYHKGEFINVKLSDYRPKWVVMCFYPAAFTFV